MDRQNEEKEAQNKTWALGTLAIFGAASYIYFECW